LVIFEKIAKIITVMAFALRRQSEEPEGLTT
jgi:hypothetical protein